MMNGELRLYEKLKILFYKLIIKFINLLNIFNQLYIYIYIYNQTIIFIGVHGLSWVELKGFFDPIQSII